MSIATFVQVLKACESASGAGSKAVIKDALAKLSHEGRKLMWYAMNPYLTFGVKKYTRPSEYADVDSPLSTITDVLDQLAARELTGNAARDTVTLMLGAFTKETSSYLERILDKDLKAGFSPATYNKVWPNDPVPVFDVMLADKCENEEDFAANIAFPCQADWKYDGERTIAIVEGSKITYFSRSGLEADHCNGLFDDELRLLHTFLGYDFVLDAERFAADWTDTMNAKKSDNHDAKARLMLRAFFLMPLSDWKQQSTPITMRTNRANIKAWLKALPSITRIVLSGGREVKDYQDMIAYCDEVTTPGFDGQPKGHEGLILKDWNATYAWDRTIAWCKVKKFYTVDARIVSFEPGRPKSKYAGTIGRANCVGFLEDGTRVEFGVGSGFKDHERDEMRDNPQKYLSGRVFVEVKYQEVSKAKGKDTMSLRFPTVFRFRDDKTIEID